MCGFGIAPWLVIECRLCIVSVGSRQAIFWSNPSGIVLSPSGIGVRRGGAATHALGTNAGKPTMVEQPTGSRRMAGT